MHHIMPPNRAVRSGGSARSDYSINQAFDPVGGGSPNPQPRKGKLHASAV